MELVQISTTERVPGGKKATKALRREGKIPGVLYGGGQEHHFATKMSDVKSVIYTPDFKLCELDIDGTKHKAILKDIQWHPVTDSIVHMDFLALRDDHPVLVEIPVRFKGVSPGVKAGGALIQSMRKIKIKTTPDKIISEAYADISEVELGEAIRVKDLEIPEGIHVVNDPNIPVASVDVPRALKAEDAAEEEGAAEGEEGAAEGAEGAAPAENS